MISPLRAIGLLSLAVLLGWTLWESRWQPTLPAAPEMVDTAAPEAPTPAAPAPPLSDYGATLERPLFFPGRRFPSTTTAATPAASGPAPAAAPRAARPSLSAVIEEHGERSALLTAPGQATSTRLRPGEQLGGWKLVSIDDDGVTVEQDGRREKIPLRSYGDAPAPPPAKPAAPRPPAPQPLRFIRHGIGNGGNAPPE